MDSLGTLSRSFREFRKVFGYFFECQTVFSDFQGVLESFSGSLIFLESFQRLPMCFRDFWRVSKIF